jgi:hypothetical protein
MESVQMARRTMELQAAGEGKGNFASRLSDALEVLRRRKGGRASVRTDRKDARDGFIAAGEDSAGRQNPHSIGML